MSKNLIFLSQLKTHLGEEDSYTSNDANLKLSIEVTTSLFESIVGRSFTKQDYVEYYKPEKSYREVYLVNVDHLTRSSTYDNKHQYILLKNWPVDTNRPFKVYYDVNLNFGPETELSNTMYRLDPISGLLVLKIYTDNVKDSIRVEYTAGYSDSVDVGVTENLNDPTQERALGLNIPSDLKQAALYQAALYASQLQASLCNSDDNKDVFVSGRSFVEMYQINPVASLHLSKYKRKTLRLI